MSIKEIEKELFLSTVTGFLGRPKINTILPNKKYYVRQSARERRHVVHVEVYQRGVMTNRATGSHPSICKYSDSR